MCYRKIFSFKRKLLHFLFQLHSNGVCMFTVVSVKITIKIFNFFLWISLTFSEIWYAKSLVFQRISPLPFQLSDNSICMPIILCEIFPKKYLQFGQISYVIPNYIMQISDENLQFYHISSSFFNWILIIFDGYHCIWYFFKKISNIIHYLMLSSILSYIC